MAFVSRTERIISFVPNQTSDLGPGQYIKATNFTRQIYPSKAPFLISSQREEIGGRSKTPGVGSYNIDANNRISLQMQSQNQKYLDYKPILTENANLINGKDIMGKSNGFLSTEKRFKEKKEDVEIPGPGAYIKEMELKPVVEQRHHQELMSKKIPNFKPLSGSNCRILSIPNKNQGFGYEIVDNKLVVLNDDPDIDAKYDGINGRVGPGRYEIEKPKTWHRKGTSWSKSTVTRLDNNCYNKKKEKITDIKTLRKSMDEEQSTFYKTGTDFSKTSSGFYDNKKHDKGLVYKHIKNRENTYRYNVQTSKQRNTAGINQLIYKETPGPGYYYNKESTKYGYDEKEVPELTQNFGSTCNRFENKKIENELGPGTYFNDKNKKKKRAESIVEAPFSSQSQRKMKFGMSEADIPGPGFYNPIKDTRHHKRSYSCKHVMVNTEKKFATSKFKVNTPGPGAYLVENEFKPKMNSNEIINILNPKGVSSERLVAPLQKDVVPPVGSYNSDMLTNLDYKVAKKVNRMALVNAPFNSFNKRFKAEIPSVDTLGPGGYIKLNKVQKEQVYPPFKESAERFKENKSVNNNLGPGLYNPQSYFGWAQRTYNVLYIDNNREVI